MAGRGDIVEQRNMGNIKEIGSTGLDWKGGNGGDLSLVHWEGTGTSMAYPKQEELF